MRENRVQEGFQKKMIFKEIWCKWGPKGINNPWKINTWAPLGRISVAYGNIPAPGLGRSGCKRKFSCVGVANGNLQVLRELGCQKTWCCMIFDEKYSKMEPKGCQKRSKWSQKGAKTSRGDLKRTPCGKVWILGAKRLSASNWFGSRFGVIFCQNP